MSVRNQLPFAQIPEWVLFSPLLSHQAVRVYGVLQRYADKEGRGHPSRASIAAKANCSRPAVDRAIRELEKAGALERQPRFDPPDETGRRRQTSNDYLVKQTPPVIAGDDRVVPGPLFAGDDPPVIAGDEPGTIASSEREPSTEREMAALQHHALMATFVEVIGRKPAGGEGGKWASVADLMLQHKVSPEEFRARARLYRAEWPEVEFNPNAVWSHWGRFDPAVVVNGHGGSYSARTREMAEQLRGEGR